jgi:tetratricopeptide (TPR) repeat protein
MKSRRPAPAKPAAATAASPWILAWWRDLLLFVGTPLLIAPLFLAAGRRFTPDQISVVVASFGAIGHHLPGLLRAYGDRALFARFKTRFIAAPLFLAAVCVAFRMYRLIVLGAQERFAEAAVQFRTAIRLRPELAAAHANLALALHRTEDFDGAIREYEEALKLQPDDAGTHVNAGLAYESRGRTREAALHYLRAVQLEPANPAARECLERLQRQEARILSSEGAAR